MQAWGGFFAYTAAWLTATAEIISWVTEINVWVTENTGKSRGYTESCCKYVTNPWLFTAIEDISLII